MTGNTLTNNFLRKKTNRNQILQLNQINVKLTFNNYLNSVNSLINIHAPLKKLSKKETFRKHHGLPKVLGSQFIRRIDSLKNISSTITKIINSLYITSINLIETIYQHMKQSKKQYSNDVKNIKNVRNTGK